MLSVRYIVLNKIVNLYKCVYIYELKISDKLYEGNK